MFGLLGLLFWLAATLVISPYDSTHELVEFNVLKELDELGSGLLDEGMMTVAYAEQFFGNVNSLAFKKIVTLYKENEHQLKSCGEPLAADLYTASACFYLTGDVANITQIFLNGTRDVSGLLLDLVAVLKEIDGCKSASIFGKYGCYMKAFGDCQALVEKYAIRINQLLLNTTAVMQHLATDIHNCFGHTNTTRFSDRFEQNIALCKLKLI